MTVLESMRQRERIERARQALVPLLELARRVNEEIERGTPWEEVMDLDWWTGWICIQEDIEDALGLLGGS